MITFCDTKFWNRKPRSSIMRYCRKLWSLTLKYFHVVIEYTEKTYSMQDTKHNISKALLSNVSKKNFVMEPLGILIMFKQILGFVKEASLPKLVLSIHIKLIKWNYKHMHNEQVLDVFYL